MFSLLSQYVLYAQVNNVIQVRVDENLKDIQGI